MEKNLTCKAFAAHKLSLESCCGSQRGRAQTWRSQWDYLEDWHTRGPVYEYVKLGQHILRYLNQTVGDGLNFQPCAMRIEEGHQQLPAQNKLFMYTDISYAPPHEDYEDSPFEVVEL
eukprot:s489_g12.t1